MKKLTDAEKTEKQNEKERLEDIRIMELQKNQKPVKEITITIEWKKSRTWGMNPHAEGRVEYINGKFEIFEASASGCGYDKESTVIANIFNKCLKYRLWEIEDNKFIPLIERPYGVYLDNESVYFSGAIGTNCYYHIAEYIGGKFEMVASGKTFDVYRFTMLQ
jgi:hypothetical protein